ncbi:MAG: ATP synthase subunit C [Syntrophobacteraceae bacterium]|nr:ATP synthase subunit C [Syntrophobacteraceae bacterium]
MSRNSTPAFWVSTIFMAMAGFFSPALLYAAGMEQARAGGEWVGLAYLSAALAVGMACIASAFAVAKIGSAAIGAMTEKPELVGRCLVILGLAEGIAIYGMIVAIMIVNKL